MRAPADRLGTLERIDVLVNSAGLMAGQRWITADEVFAVNHLAPFLLTNLLPGKLAAAGGARAITVTSGAQPSPAARDDATAHRLRQLSEELTGLTSGDRAGEPF